MGSIETSNAKVSSIASRIAAWPPLAQHFAAAIVLTPTYFLAYETSRVFWYTPAGLRFTAFLLLPQRFWPWLFASFYAFMLPHEIYWKVAPAQMAFSIFEQPAASLLAVWLFRRKWLRLPPDSPASMALLLACIVTAAILCTLCNLAYGWSWIWSVGKFDFGLTNLAISAFTGDLGGILMIAPIALTLRFPRSMPPIQALARDAILGLILPFALLAWLNFVDADPMTGDYTRVLIVLPALYFGFRYGWRGAALCITLIGVVLYPYSVIHWDVPNARATTHLLFALIAMSALLLGAAIDAQRQSRNELAARNAELEKTSSALRDAAQRNLSIEEEQRRKFAAELHDELGQNLTAVQTRVKLAEAHLNVGQLNEVTAPIYDILATMRKSVHGMMESLRPPVLDDFGLQRALDEGPIRDMVEQAGLRFEFRVFGDASLIEQLNDDVRLALYRSAQEAATNTVRYAQAETFRLHLRLRERRGAILAVLNLRDNGAGLIATHDSTRTGYGLRGLEDRAVALSGKLRIVSGNSGTLLHVMLQQG